MKKITFLTGFFLVIFVSYFSSLYAKEQQQEKKKLTDEQKIQLLVDKLSEDPKNIIIWNNLGYFYEKVGNIPKAIESYQAALEIDKTFIPPNYSMGNLLFKMGKVDESMVFYKRIINIDLKYWRAYYALAMIYSSKKEYKTSLENFEKTLEFNPESLDSYYFMAKIYEEMKQYAKAVRKYKEFVVLSVRMKKTKEYLIFLKDAEMKVKELEKYKGAHI